MGEENLGRAVLALATDNAGLDKGLDDAEGKSKSWTARVGGVLGKGLAVGAGLAIGAGAALVAVLGDSVGAAMDAQRSEAQLDAVLKSTGEAAAKQAAEYAKASATHVSGTKLSGDALAALNTKLTDNKLHYNSLTSSMQEQRQKVIDLTARYGDNGLATIKAKDKLAEMENQAGKLKSTIGDLSAKVASGSQVIGGTLAQSLGLVAPAARMTKDGIIDLANSLSLITPIEDDTIVSGESMLLTFTNIGKDIFPQTTKTLLDMATAMNSGATPSAEQLKAQAIQLGKAIDDPIAGVGALSRVGVQFTDQQKAQIKAMVEAGDTMGAQKLILKELNTEFGGSAEAAGKTFAGQMQILNNQIGNVKEEIGGALIPILSELATKYGPQVIEAVKAIAGWMTTSLIPAIKNAAEWIGTNLVPAVQQAADWLGKNLPVAMAVINDVIQKVTPFIQGLIGAFQGMAAGANESSGFVAQAWAKIQDIISVVVPAIQSIVTSVFGAIQTFMANHGDEIKKFMGDAWKQIQQIIMLALEVYQATIPPVLAAVAGFLRTHGAEIQAVLGGAWNIIKGVIQTALDLITGILKVALAVIHGDWSGAWQIIKDTASTVWADIQTIVGGAVAIFETTLGDAWTRIKKGAVDAFNGLKDTVVNAFNGVIDGIKGKLNGAIDLINKAIRTFNGIPGVPDIGEIPRLASGAINFGGGWAVVGERGPELVNLPAGSDVYPNRQTAGMLGNTYNIDARGSNWTEAMFQQQMQLALARVGQAADTRGRMR